MAIDATPKSPTANSYLTVIEANGILTGEWLNATAWTANSAKQEAALIMATFLMDACFEYDGSPRTLEQALRLPRAGLVTQDGFTVDMDTIPAVAKKACAVLANSLLTTNRIDSPALLGLGISSASLGPLSVSIDAQQVKEMIPREVEMILAPIAQLSPAAGSRTRVVKLERG